MGGDAPEYNRRSVESRRRREGVMRSMRCDFKKFQVSFFQLWEHFLNWSKFNVLSTHPRSVLHPMTLPTLLCPLCSGASPPTRADLSPLLFFFSKYAKPCALAPSANSTRCGAPLSHDVSPLPPLPKSAQKRSPLSVQVKAVEF